MRMVSVLTLMSSAVFLGRTRSATAGNVRGIFGGFSHGVKSPELIAHNIEVNSHGILKGCTWLPIKVAEARLKSTSEDEEDAAPAGTWKFKPLFISTSSTKLGFPPTAPSWAINCRSRNVHSALLKQSVMCSHKSSIYNYNIYICI